MPSARADRSLFSPRRAAFAATLLAAATAVHCSPPPAPPPVRPFERHAAAASSGSQSNGTARRHIPMRHRLAQGAETPPALDAAASCDPAIEHALAALHPGAWHLLPVCSANYSGEWAAIAVTGTPEEATDVWVVLHGDHGVEAHRVHRTPVGVHYTAATFADGYGILVGESIASEEMPAGEKTLVVFPVPRPGDRDPDALGLTPAEVPLVGAQGRADVATRLESATGDAPPAAADAERVVRAVLNGGARALIAALPSGGGVPVLRAWQLGVYEPVTLLHPELDPANARLTTALDVLREIGTELDCSAGDRCVARPRPAPVEPPEARVPTQVLLRREGPNTVIAAIVQAARRPEAMANANNDRLGTPVDDAPEDRALAASLGMGGTVTGRTTAITRGGVRLVAFDLAQGAHHEAAIYALAPHRAPRRFDDRAFGALATGPRELYFRDLEHNEEPEVVSVAHLATGQDAVGVSTLFWPPAVIDRATVARLDATRAVLDAHAIADADRVLHRFQPIDADETSVCAALEHLNGTDPRALAAAVPGAFVEIEYAEPWLPLYGTVRRTPVRALRAGGNATLAPFVGARCAELACDFYQGYCRRENDGQDAGYLWLSGQRRQPFWGVSRHVAR